MVKLLLNSKADPNIRSPYGWTPLIAACQNMDVEIVKLLLKRGAKPNQLTGYGDTAIIYAANVDKGKAVEALIRAGADLNGGTGASALIEAAMSSHLDIVKLLLKHGANPNFHRSEYSTPLDIAIEQSYVPEIADVLRRAGAKGRPKAQLDKDTKAQEAKWSEQFAAEAKSAEKTNSQFAKLLPEDSAVISAVMVDLATYSGDDFEHIRGPDRVKVILEDATWVAGAFVEGQMNSELDERKANAIDLDMRRDLLRRNCLAVSLTNCPLSDSRVLLKKAGSYSTDFMGMDRDKSGARAFVRTMLPGYSVDGMRAVVSFIYGPTSHGAAGTILIAKTGGKWTVVWRAFAHYV